MEMHSNSRTPQLDHLLCIHSRMTDLDYLNSSLLCQQTSGFDLNSDQLPNIVIFTLIGLKTTGFDSDQLPNFIIFTLIGPKTRVENNGS